MAGEPAFELNTNKSEKKNGKGKKTETAQGQERSGATTDSFLSIPKKAKDYKIGVNFRMEQSLVDAVEELRIHLNRDKSEIYREIVRKTLPIFMKNAGLEIPENLKTILDK